jgi:hypothetical protein
MKAILGVALVAIFTGFSAHGAKLTCPSTTDKGSYLQLEIRKGALPARLEGAHRYNRGSSYVALDCTKKSKIVASAVVYSCADGTYGVDYANLSLSPLAFQGAPRFPVKLIYLDENSGGPSGAMETFQCGLRK